MNYLHVALSPLFIHPPPCDNNADPGVMADGSGCTAVIVLVTEDMRVICANAGDSRAVLSVDGTAFPLSHDHKPENPSKCRVASLTPYHPVCEVSSCPDIVQMEM